MAELTPDEIRKRLDRYAVPSDVKIVKVEGTSATVDSRHLWGIYDVSDSAMLLQDIQGRAFSEAVNAELRKRRPKF